MPRYRRRCESKNLARSKEVRSGSKMKASRLRPAAFQRRCPAVSWTKSCLSKKPHVLPDAQRDAGSLSHKMHNGQLYMELRSADKGENRISRGRKHGSHLGDTWGGSHSHEHCQWEAKMAEPLWETAWCFFWMSAETPYNPRRSSNTSPAPHRDSYINAHGTITHNNPKRN